MAILSLLWQKVSQCLGLVKGWLCSHLACPLGQSSWTFSLSRQMCTRYPTDWQRNWKELVGGSPMGKKGVLFQALVSVCPSLEYPSSFCGEGWWLWCRRLLLVHLSGTGGLLSFSLCQLSPIESEACFEKSLCCCQHFPDPPGCCKISTGANRCFWDIKTSFWVCF